MVYVMRALCAIVPELVSYHEEADSRMLLHAKQASSNSNRIVIQSPDTDVAVLCVAQFSMLHCEVLWFRTGVKDKLRYMPIHTVAQQLGQTMCASLLPYHALTGYDSTSSLCGIGKKK